MAELQEIFVWTPQRWTEGAWAAACKLVKTQQQLTNIQDPQGLNGSVAGNVKNTSSTTPSFWLVELITFSVYMVFGICLAALTKVWEHTTSCQRAPDYWAENRDLVESNRSTAAGTQWTKQVSWTERLIQRGNASLGFSYSDQKVKLTQLKKRKKLHSELSMEPKHHLKAFTYLIKWTHLWG